MEAAQESDSLVVTGASAPCEIGAPTRPKRKRNPRALKMIQSSLRFSPARWNPSETQQFLIHCVPTPLEMIVMKPLTDLSRPPSP